MIIYISGPMKGIKDGNKKEFAEAEKYLKLRNHTVINPHNITGLSYNDCMRKDICEMMKCDAIYMLRGWEKSNGAKCELKIAIDLEMRILFQEVYTIW